MDKCSGYFLKVPYVTWDTKGLGIYVGFSNNVLEHNVIDGCRAGGIVVQFSNPTNTIVRYNVIKNGGIHSPWPPPSGFTIQGGTGINVGPETQGTLVYNNIFSHIRSDPRGGYHDSDCILIYDNATATTIYNNTCYDSDNGIVFGLGGFGGPYNADVRNNIFSSVL